MEGYPWENGLNASQYVVKLIRRIFFFVTGSPLHLSHYHSFPESESDITMSTIGLLFTTMGILTVQTMKGMFICFGQSLEFLSYYGF